MLFIALLVIAYLFGSLSSAIIFCKMAGLPDPRSQGSGNPGATNVLRFGGKKLAIIVLIGDALKGAMPVLIARILGFEGMELGWIAFAAFLGHLFPIYFKFQGGKGVATALGVLIILSLPLTLIALIVWILTAVITRYSSLAALVATLAVSIACIWLVQPGEQVPILLMNLLLIARHHENIKRLFSGAEGKIGVKKVK